MKKLPALAGYGKVHSGIVQLLESARRAAARSVNVLMTASYWEVGRRIVEFEQGGKGAVRGGPNMVSNCLNGFRLTLQPGSVVALG